MFSLRCRAVRTLFILMSLATTMWRGEVGAAQLTASWGNPTSGDQSGFYVERAAGTTGAFAQIAATAATMLSYVDTSLTGGSAYCYRARAYNATGTSNYSNTACGTAPTDTQPPTVSLTAPVNGATVSGSSVTVSASASDNSGVAGVQFQLDGVNLNAEDTTSPYAMTWDTTTATNGSHSLRALARDAAGNTATSTAVTVTVSNSTPPPPPPTAIGNTKIGSAVDSGNSNYRNGSKVTVGTSSVTATALSVYVGAVDTAPYNQYQVAIYTDQNGTPGTMVASSATSALSPSAWNTQPLQAVLQANTSYWLMYNTNGRTDAVNNMYYNLGSAGQGAYSSNVTPFGNWPTTFGAATITTANYSIYATTASAPPPSPTTIGNTKIGSAMDSGNSNHLNGSKITVGTSSMTITALSAYVGAVDTAPYNQYQVAIYTDQNGTPGTMVASSAAGSLSPNAWNTQSLKAVLQANTSYWLMYNSNGRTYAVNNMYYNLGSAGQGAYKSSGVSFGSWPTTFGSATLTTASFSLYATAASGM